MLNTLNQFLSALPLFVCTQEEIESTTCPTLLIHGLKDTVVPHTHSLELYRASPASQKVWKPQHFVVLS